MLNCGDHADHVTRSVKMAVAQITSKIFFSGPISQNATKFVLQHYAKVVGMLITLWKLLLQVEMLFISRNFADFREIETRFREISRNQFSSYTKFREISRKPNVGKE